MKVLFVNACVREDSRTLYLCRKYIEKHYPAHEVKEVVLTEEALMPFNGEMLRQRESDIMEGKLYGEAYRHARDLADSDVVMIGAPYWDCSFPSILKVYIEHICVNGITFRYDMGRPVKLGKTDKLVYIATAGGYIPKDGSLEGYIRELCAMLGISQTEFHFAQGLDIYGNDVQKILDDTISSL